MQCLEFFPKVYLELSLCIIQLYCKYLNLASQLASCFSLQHLLLYSLTVVYSQPSHCYYLFTKILFCLEMQSHLISNLFDVLSFHSHNASHQKLSLDFHYSCLFELLSVLNLFLIFHFLSKDPQYFYPSDQL